MRKVTFFLVFGLLFLISTLLAVDPDLYEPDNSSSQFQIIGVSSVAQTQNHTIHTTSDQDWYRFNVYSGRIYKFVVTGIALSFVLYRDDGTSVISSANNVSTFQYNFTEDGNFKLKVTGYSGATGAYTIQYLYVSSPDMCEPDDTALTATDLFYYEESSQYHTLHSYTDQDWYKFRAEAGGTYSFWSTGNTDTKVLIYGSDGTTLLAQDDYNGDGSNFLINFSPTTSGTYYIKVVGSTDWVVGAYTFNFDSTFISDSYEPDNTVNQFTPLSIISTAQIQQHTIQKNDEDWYGFSVVQGRTYILYTIANDPLININTDGYLYNSDGTVLLTDDDDSGDGNNFRIEYYAATSGYVKLNVIGFYWRGFYQLHYYSWAPLDSYEPDNTASAAKSISITQSAQVQTHTLNLPTDQDWYQFIGYAGNTYSFSSTGYTNTKVYLYMQDGVTQLASNDDHGTDINFLLEYTPSITATYKLKVVCHSSGSFGYYDMHYLFRADADSYEPDNSSTQFTTITPGNTLQSQVHTFHSTTDVDWFRFNAQPGMTYYFYSTGQTNTEMSVRQDNGSLTGGYDDDSGESPHNFYFAFQALMPGYYKLAVYGHGGSTGGYQFYYTTNRALNTPTDVIIMKSGGSVQLSWTAVNGAISYRIEASDNPNTGFTEIGTTSFNSWSELPTQAHKFYRVVAMD